MEKEYFIEERKVPKDEAIKHNLFSIKYSKGSNFIFQENYFEGKLTGIVLQNLDKINHRNLFNSYSQKDVYIQINEIELIGNYRLERKYNYTDNFHLLYEINDVFDEDNELIAHEIISEGITEYHLTFKQYFDREINPNEEIFESTFDDKGNLFCLLFNNHHIDPYGQDSEGFILEDEDIKAVQMRTGLNEKIIRYYMLPDVVLPNLLSD